MGDLFQRKSVVSGFGLVVLGLFAGCATVPASSVAPEPAPAEKKDVVIVVPVPAGENTAVPAPTSMPAVPAANDPAVQAAPVTIAETNFLDRRLLPDFAKISIDIPQADLIVSAGHAKRDTSFRIQSTKEKSDCKLKVVETKTELKILPAEPAHDLTATSTPARTPASSCRFAIQIQARQAADLSLHIGAGSILVERWENPIGVKMEAGDVDAGLVGPFNLDCGRCTFAGEGFSGPLVFQIESGNVGLAGLTSSVDGKTYGDMILRWKSVRADTHVKITSRAGDIMMSVPKGTQVSTKLSAPRGDVDMRLKPAEKGIPVVAVAELGNIRIVPAGK